MFNPKIVLFHFFVVCKNQNLSAKDIQLFAFFFFSSLKVKTRTELQKDSI